MRIAEMQRQMPPIHQVVGLGAEPGCLERIEALFQARIDVSGAHLGGHPARGDAHLHEPAGGRGDTRLDRPVLETVSRPAGRAALGTQTKEPQRLEVSYLGPDVRLHRQAACRGGKDDPGVEGGVATRGIARVRGVLDELVVISGDVAASEDEPGPGRHTAQHRTEPAEPLREDPPRQTESLQAADPVLGARHDVRRQLSPLLFALPLQDLLAGRRELDLLRAELAVGGLGTGNGRWRREHGQQDGDDGVTGRWGHSLA